MTMETYLVGGAVRDKLLGLPVGERDWVVIGETTSRMLERGYRQVGRDFPVFLHPDSNEEYALARTERKTGSGHTGFECDASETVTLLEDLQRRDLTINAIAEDEDGTIIDLVGGGDDLVARRLRHVSPAFTEDPLRILRVARFMAQLAEFGFRVDPDTLTLVRNMVARGDLAELPPERIFTELRKAFTTPGPARFLITLADMHALTVVFPEWRDIDPTWFAAVAAEVPDPVNRYALLAANLDRTAARTLSERLRVPNAWRDLADLTAQWGNDVATESMPDAAWLLGLIEGTDALRRGDRFLRFLAVATALGTTDQVIGQITRGLAAVRSIDAGAVVRDLAPAEIPARLRDVRLAAITRAMAGTT